MEKKENKNEGFSSYYYVLFFNQPIFFFSVSCIYKCQMHFQRGGGCKKKPTEFIFIYRHNTNLNLVYFSYIHI